MTTSKKWQIRIFFIIWFIICYSPWIQLGPLHFLLLNTFLAYIPIELSFQINHHVIKDSWLIWPFLIAWLLFYPNAAYILTDLFHLSLLNPYNQTTGLLRGSINMWANFFMLLTSALTCAWIGFQTMFQVINTVCQKVHLNGIGFRYFMIIIITILNAIGIFIGRFLRLHTIYLFLSPRLFINPLLRMWTPQMMSFVVIMIMVQFACYWLIYLTRASKKDVTK